MVADEDVTDLDLQEKTRMVVSPDVEAQVLRLHHAEKWPVGTIAAQLGVHHDTVRRILAKSGVAASAGLGRPTKLDPYLPFIVGVLEKYPRLAASRVFSMARERGYPGSASRVRKAVARLRPRPRAEAFLRLKTLPGEQGQADWGHFGHLVIGRAKRPIMAFVMVLSYSRQVFLRFYLNARCENFLHGHVAAFDAWGGVPRVVLYDNLKSAVLERQGSAIRFNDRLLAFAGHYRFEPRPVAVARGNEKGRVERSIRYIRDAFFAAREFKDIDDLNAQADAWCVGEAADRRWPEDSDRKVREVFAEETKRLLPLPDNPPPLLERLEVRVGKTPYVRFDLNDYSVRHEYVQRTLTVFADQNELRIMDGSTVVARHRRSYDRGQQIEDVEHINRLADEKRAAKHHGGTNRLLNAVPVAQDLLVEAAVRGSNLGAITAQLLRLLDCYGAAELREAIKEALARGVPHNNAVRLALERRRHERGEKPLIEVEMPAHVKAQEAVARPHDLADYDHLRGDDDV